MSTTDHMNMSLPSRRHVASLLLNTKHLGSLRNTFYLSILSPWRSLSPPVEVILSLSDVISLSDKLWCDLSLPLWHQFPRRVFWNLLWMGLVLESQHKALDKIVMLVEDKIHWVELDQKKHRISGKLFFLLRNRWHRVACFGSTEGIRLDQE